MSSSETASAGASSRPTSGRTHRRGPAGTRARHASATVRSRARRPRLHAHRPQGAGLDGRPGDRARRRADDRPAALRGDEPGTGDERGPRRRATLRPRCRHPVEIATPHARRATGKRAAAKRRAALRARRGSREPRPYGRHRPVAPPPRRGPARTRRAGGTGTAKRRWSRPRPEPTCNAPTRS